MLQSDQLALRPSEQVQEPLVGHIIIEGIMMKALAKAGAAPGQPYRVRDLLTGAVYPWSDRNYVRLAPVIEPAHILRVESRL